jgi:hypothetical protein
VWVPHDVRDLVVDFVRCWSERTEIGIGRFIHWLGVRASKFYDWRERYGRVNEHNGWVPRDFWLAPWEKQAIIDFHRAFLIHSLEQAGRFDEVIAQRTIIAAQFGNSVEHTNALRQRYKSEGVRGYWKYRIAEMGGKPEDKPEAALETASLYARLGDKDRAFSFLERALEYHDLWAEYLKVDPQWENLHGDSRYELALKHAGLN